MNGPRSIPAAAALAPRSTPRTRSGEPLLPAPAGRLVAFAALAAYGATQWGRLLAPAAGGAMVAALLAALAAGGALAAVAGARPPARLRCAAGVAAAAALLLVALAGAGVPAALLDPRGWDALVGGIGQGLSAVPTISVPYRGVEEWTRSVLILGGGALIGVAALLAFAPRRDGRLGYPVAAALALATLYAVPVIQRNAERPFLAGTAFALLLALFLWLERVERRNAALAASLVALAAVAGLVAAPRLDGARALLDYEELAQSLSPAASTQYSWNHSYRALDWPRDGREVLRVRSPRRSYWKAVNLTAFDGVRWVQDIEQRDGGIDMPASVRDWVQMIRVTVRALRSTQFVAAGTTLHVEDNQRAAVPSAPGVFETVGEPLGRGHAYTAIVYVPRPTTRQLRAAGTDYPASLRADYGVLRVPQAGSGAARARQVALPFLDALAPPGQAELAAATLAESPYARVYALARRLRARARTPYEFMLAVERFLTRGFAYSETPPPSRTPLADFLLRDRVGYCQQFSGAMALLLRMGGVPARVSAGFAPGVVDDRRKEYVVRDIDAHSWVEVYFPGIGWVTRDPTPAASPARSQTADLAASGQDSSVTVGGAGERALGGSTDRGRASSPAVATDDGGSSPGVAWIAAGLLALAAALAAIVRWRRRQRPTGPEDDLAELRRALRRSGREPQPDLTLELLAQRFGGTRAEGYLRTLVGARYGYASGSPTGDQRAALRRELGAGLGIRGRVRAWWALPPRPAAPRRSGSSRAAT